HRHRKPVRARKRHHRRVRLTTLGRSRRGPPRRLRLSSPSVIEGGGGMVEIVYYAAASLDGFIATPDGSVDWLPPIEAGGEDYGYGDFYASADAILMGSATYENILRHA